MKTSEAKRWLQAVTACSILTASAGARCGQITNYVGIFTNSADTAAWATETGGATASFMAGDAPAGGPSSGSLLWRGIFSPTENLDGIHVLLPALNVSDYNALEFDVKVLGPFDRYRQIQSIQPVLETGTNLDYQKWTGDDANPKLVYTSANNGWQHIIIPAGEIDGGNITNWENVGRLILNVYDGNYTSTRNVSLEFSNIMFTGVRKPSWLVWSLCAVGVAAITLITVCRKRRPRS